MNSSRPTTPPRARLSAEREKSKDSFYYSEDLDALNESFYNSILNDQPKAQTPPPPTTEPLFNVAFPGPIKRSVSAPPPPKIPYNKRSGEKAFPSTQTSTAKAVICLRGASPLTVSHEEYEEATDECRGPKGGLSLAAVRAAIIKKRLVEKEISAILEEKPEPDSLESFKLS